MADVQLALKHIEQCRFICSRMLGALHRSEEDLANIEAKLSKAGRTLQAEDKAALEDVSNLLELNAEITAITVEIETALRAPKPEPKPEVMPPSSDSGESEALATIEDIITP